MTWPEVDAWCVAVAGIAPDSLRPGYYVRYWNVIGKIQQTKLAGTFQTLIAALN